MTNHELNRDIKKLYKNIKSLQGSETVQGSKNYFAYIDNEAKEEFKRLYYADSSFNAMNKESVLMMLRMNLRHRFFALHTFGLMINY